MRTDYGTEVVNGNVIPIFQRAFSFRFLSETNVIAIKFFFSQYEISCLLKQLCKLVNPHHYAYSVNLKCLAFANYLAIFNKLWSVSLQLFLVWFQFQVKLN